jgi:hypothetical protein
MLDGSAAFIEHAFGHAVATSVTKNTGIVKHVSLKNRSSEAFMPSDLANVLDDRFKRIDPAKALHEILDSVRQLAFMRQHCDTLLEQLKEKIRLTYGKAPLGRLKPNQTYHLQQPMRHDPAVAERHLEKLIWMQWDYLQARSKGLPFYGETCKFIQTYQMPLQWEREDRGWGRIDLVGASSNALPVIIELKDKKAHDTPLRMLTEGLAYGCAVKKAWSRENSKLRRQWTSAMEGHSITNTYPETITPLPVMLLAPSDFWNRKIGKPGSHTNGKVKQDAWKPFTQLCDECKEYGFHIFCVQFEIDTSDPETPVVSQGSKVQFPD